MNELENRAPTSNTVYDPKIFTIVAKGHVEGTSDGAVNIFEKADKHARITHNKVNDTDKSTNESISHLKTDMNRTLHNPVKTNAIDHPNDRAEETGSDSEVKNTRSLHENYADSNASTTVDLE